MHRIASFGNGAHGTKLCTEPLTEIRHLEFCRHSVFVRSDQRKARKPCGHIGNGGSHTAMHQTDLLLVLLPERDLGFDIAGLDHCEHTSDVLHEFLAFQVANDRLAEVWVFHGEVHAAKVAPPRVNFT